jgi:hypothetical protein
LNHAALAREASITKTGISLAALLHQAIAHEIHRLVSRNDPNIIVLQPIIPAQAIDGFFKTLARARLQFHEHDKLRTSLLLEFSSIR